MLKRLALALAVTTGLSLAQVQAPPSAPAAAPGPLTVYLSPFLMTGDYKPVTQDELNASMAASVKEVAGNITMVMGPTPTKALTDNEVIAQARARNCRYALHGTVEFATQNLTLNASGATTATTATGYPSSGAVPQSTDYRYLVTVKGNADVNLLDAVKGFMIAEHPEALWRSQTTQAPLDTEAYDDVEAALAKDCVSQLSHRLILHLEGLVPGASAPK